MTIDPTTAGRPIVLGSDPLHDLEAAVRDVLVRWFDDPATSGFDHLARTVVQALLADPVATRHGDGTVTLAWPTEHAGACIVARPVLDELVADLNRYRAGADYTPAPEAVEPTDGQWWAAMLTADPQTRLERIVQLRDDVRRGVACWLEQHRERLEPCEVWSEPDGEDTSYRCMLPSRYPHPVHWHITGVTWSVETGGKA